MAMCCYYHLRLVNRLLPIMTQSTHCNQMVADSPPSLRIELAKSPKAWEGEIVPESWPATPHSGALSSGANRNRRVCLSAGWERPSLHSYLGTDASTS